MQNKIGKLIIARHQESEWNKLGKWTGTRDRHLTDVGFKQAEDMGLLIKDLQIDYAFASMQVRSIETLSCMLNICERFSVPTEHSASLNERDYGDYTGRDKEEMEKILGEDEFNKMHRGFDYPIPNGETLKMVYDRVVKFYLSDILLKLKEGKNVLVVGHGNSMRTLVKYIEKISDEDIANVEFPFGKVLVYEVDEEGHMLNKSIIEPDHSFEKTDTPRSQIIATLGPVSEDEEILKGIVLSGADLLRFNFSWLDLEKAKKYFELVNKIRTETNKNIKIIADLPGPRIQEGKSHTYEKNAIELTTEDVSLIKFAVENKADYIALSFVANKDEVLEAKKYIEQFGGTQKVISKIERQVALDNLGEIVEVTDAVMVARGDLGNEIPVEKIPFVQEDIIKKSKALGKPVIVATQMLYSMKENKEPTRSEVTDISEAILQGADCLMLSDETAVGKFPVESVKTMDKIILEAEKHTNTLHINFL